MIFLYPTYSKFNQLKYNNYPMGRIPLHTYTNKSPNLTNYFLSEDKQLIPRIWINCVHPEKGFWFWQKDIENIIHK